MTVSTSRFQRAAPVKRLAAGLLFGLTAAIAVVAAPRLAHAGGCGKGEKHVEHEIARGQTLSHVAYKYGVSINDLERTNPGLDPNVVRLGQKIDVCIPPEDSGSGGKSSKSRSKRLPSCGGGGRLHTHEVSRGDTLTSIASEYGVDQKEITRRNKSLASNPDSLRVGQELKICATPASTRKHKACGYRTPLHKHEVVPGEYAASIASRYGVRRKDLYRINPKLRANPDYLSPGSTVLVCPDIAPRERSKIEYTVQSGDNLGKIANKYGLTSRELQRFQRGKVKNPNDLKIGQKLTVWIDGDIIPGYGEYDDDKGMLKHGVQMPDGRYYVVKHPNLSWGTPQTVRLIQTAISNYRGRAGGGPKVHVGDISKRGGGKFPPHRSHQTGKDVDVGYVLKGSQADETRFVNANGNNLDLDRTWKLIDAFLDTDKVRYIFMDRNIQKMLYKHARSKGVSEDTLDELFQYPKRRGGIIRHSKGHVNHFHVRFW